MTNRKPATDQDKEIRDTAVRESWPMNDPRANYPIAEQARQATAEGRDRANA